MYIVLCGTDVLYDMFLICHLVLISLFCTLALKPVLTNSTGTVDPRDRDSTSTERQVLADTAHDVKDEARAPR